MTELERYKKAYAAVVGRVDTVISKLKETDIMLNLENTALRFAADRPYEFVNMTNSTARLLLAYQYLK